MTISLTKPLREVSSIEKQTYTETILAADGKTVLKVKIQYGEQTKTETTDGSSQTTTSPTAGKTYVGEYRNGETVVTDENYKPVPAPEEELVKKQLNDLGKPNPDLTALPDVPLKPGDRADTLSEMIRSGFAEGNGELSDVVVTLKEIQVENGVKKGVFDMSFKVVQPADMFKMTMTLSGTLVIRADNGRMTKMDLAGPFEMHGPNVEGTGKTSFKETAE